MIVVIVFLATKKPNQLAVIAPNKLPEAQTVEVKSQTGCSALASEAKRKNCLQFEAIKQAAQSGDLKKCGDGAEASVLNCKAQANFSLAIQKKDKNYCGLILNQTDKEYCLKTLAEMGVK